MKVEAIRTGKITPGNQTLYSILDAHIPPLKEGSVVVITSKIVSICEGRVIKDDGSVNKTELIEKEADLYLDPNPDSTLKINITIKYNTLIANSGIDESNGANHFILWPADPQKSANEIRAHLRKRFSIKHLGIIITDSKHNPLRRGAVGVALAHSGFKAIKRYVGKEDIFGRTLLMTSANIAEGLAAAAVLAMGEGSEQTPIALVEEIPFVEFQERNPSKKDLEESKIEVEDDLYAQFLTAVQWKKGGGGKSTA